MKYMSFLWHRDMLNKYVHVLFEVVCSLCKLDSYENENVFHLNSCSSYAVSHM